MGKKNKVSKGEWNRGLMNFAGDLGGSKEAKELLDRYNVKGSSSHYGTKPSARNLEKHFRDNDVVERELNEAMMNDYDTRRSIEAAAMAGNKDAKKYAKKGIEGKKGMLGAWDVMKDLKKEYVGGGGMNGPENEAGLTHALVQADRDALNESIDSRIGAMSATQQAEEADKGFNYEGPDKEISPEMQAAKDRAAAYESTGGQGAPSPYGGGVADDQQSQASVVADSVDGPSAGGYLAAYKQKMKQERNFSRDF